MRERREKEDLHSPASWGHGPGGYISGRSSSLLFPLLAADRLSVVYKGGEGKGWKEDEGRSESLSSLFSTFICSLSYK